MSYLFDANSERLVGSFTSNYDLPITLGCWVKKNGTSWSSGSDGFMVLGETTLDQTDSITLLNPNPADRVQAITTAADDSNSSASFDADLDEYDDTWVFVYAIFTGTSDRRVGIETWTNSNQTSGTKAITGTLDQILLGNRDSGGSGHLDGFGAEFTIWKRALVEADIDALVTGVGQGPAPNTIQSADVIGYWPGRANESTLINLGSDADGDVSVAGATFSLDHPIITGDVVVANSAAIVSGADTASPSTSTTTFEAAAGEDRLLVLIINGEDMDADAFDPEFGGVAFVDATSDTTSGASGTEGYIGFIKDADIPTGAQSTTIVDGAGLSWVNNSWAGSIYTLTGVDQSNPQPQAAVEANESAATSWTTGSIVSDTGGILMIGCATANLHDSGSGISGYTEIFDIDEGGGGWRNGHKLITTGSSETATVDWNAISESGTSYIVGFQPVVAAAAALIERPLLHSFAIARAANY